ncbi:S8 family serine peptidase [Gymnodinialimonas ceratoperidinii]|uniref:S8 family serine peptidase n=1 Tax=Gymnodinialimonas ceratoperidinii TaxID=2856823 RepID=A0A8F6TU88_9RHOB|nr:S8 family serine peptidase [Gymnodinialimonas ceratoperidinii]QXT39057.1 S8 family serine peptidase [Gymnodinialimonas ceratoperidinii]
MPDWGPFSPAPLGVGPYSDHWAEQEGTYARNQSAYRSADSFIGQPSPYLLRDATFAGMTAPDVDLRNRLGRSLYELDDHVPVPTHAVNENWDASEDWLASAVDLANIPELDRDTVIVGIVDTGIPLCHTRFRTASGNTRILASWQQTTTWSGQDDLPFGRELYGSEIDALVNAHTRAGYLDEEAFNRAAGLVEPHLPFGARDLDRHASHGAHVMDLACGFAPDTTEIDPEKLRIIAVNLPPQFLHGPAGDFLQYYAAFGFRRIVGLADALWQRDHPTDPKGAYPISFNFSYGMQAGPKDGSMPLERLIRDMVAERAAPVVINGVPRLKPPLRIHMPAGNSNLYQCAAKLQLSGAGASELTWRIQPDDQTSNQLEIWTPPFAKNDLPDAADFSLALAVPNDGLVPAPQPQVGECAPFGNYARLCCFKHNVDDAGDMQRLVFLIQVAQTFRPDAAGAALAPAGQWKLAIAGPDQLDLSVYIQSDQSFIMQSPIGRRSYFDDPGYRKYRENGELADSAVYCTALGEPGSGPVSRIGTNNALGASPSIALIGGFRESDGQPALYSSTGTAALPDSDVDLLYPSEDRAATYGLRASGSRIGSTASFRGTSMATALATRDVALEMLNTQDFNLPNLFAADFLRARAEVFETNRPANFCPVDGRKGGTGRTRSSRRLRR